MPEILFDKERDKELPKKLNIAQTINTASSTLPTAEEMSQIAKRHTPEQWAMLCKSKQFMEFFPINLVRAKILIEKILAGKGDSINEKNQ